MTFGLLMELEVLMCGFRGRMDVLLYCFVRFWVCYYVGISSSVYRLTSN